MPPLSPGSGGEPTALGAAALAAECARLDVEGPGEPTRNLLLRQWDIAPYAEAYWVRGAVTDPSLVAADLAVGDGVAHAIAAAVACLDPYGVEVETVRIHAWMRDSGRLAPAATAARGDGPVAPLQPGTLPEGDAAWFARRPGRAHRFRPSTRDEVGRDPAGWVTVVALRGDGGMRLCVPEARLPRTDRGEADLRLMFDALAEASATPPSIPTPIPDENRAPTAARSTRQGSRTPVPAKAREPQRLRVAAEFRRPPEPAPGEPEQSPAFLGPDAVVESLRRKFGLNPFRAHDVRALGGPDSPAGLRASGRLLAGGDGLLRLAPAHPLLPTSG